MKHKLTRKEANSILKHFESIGRDIDSLFKRLDEYFDNYELEDVKILLQKKKERLQEAKKKMPVGHRYEGEYYLRNPPPEGGYRKENGPLFMREDLVSWIRLKKEDINTSYYLRAVFTKPEYNAYLEREQGRPVYEDQTSLYQPN